MQKFLNIFNNSIFVYLKTQAPGIAKIWKKFRMIWWDLSTPTPSLSATDWKMISEHSTSFTTPYWTLLWFFLIFLVFHIGEVWKLWSQVTSRKISRRALGATTVTRTPEPVLSSCCGKLGRTWCRQRNFLANHVQCRLIKFPCLSSSGLDLINTILLILCW